MDQDRNVTDLQIFAASVRISGQSLQDEVRIGEVASANSKNCGSDYSSGSKRPQVVASQPTFLFYVVFF
jgi:hypothetical protein